MNILLLTTHFNEGGITRYCLNLSRELKKKGHKVYVASSGGDLINLLEHAGIEHITIGLRTKSELSPKIWRCLYQLKPILKEKDIQLIHAQTRVAQVLAFWIEKYYEVPYVTTCHGFFKPRFFRKVFPCWGKKAIAISEAVRAHLIKDLKVSPQNAVCIRHGLDLERFISYDKHSRDDLKQELNLDKDALVIGIISRLSSVKGHKFLLAAMPAVLQEFPDLRLLIVGGGSLKNELIKQAENLRISRNVIFLPSVLETARILSFLDIFIMPSLQEGLGFSIMEAMAMSVPVIATNVGGIPDLIKDGQTGLLVPPADTLALSRAIIRLLKDKNLKETLGRNAKEFIIREEFSVEYMSEKTEQLCKGVLGEG